MSSQENLRLLLNTVRFKRLIEFKVSFHESLKILFDYQNIMVRIFQPGKTYTESLQLRLRVARFMEENRNRFEAIEVEQDRKTKGVLQDFRAERIEGIKAADETREIYYRV